MCAYHPPYARGFGLVDVIIFLLKWGGLHLLMGRWRVTFPLFPSHGREHSKATRTLIRPWSVDGESCPWTLITVYLNNYGRPNVLMLAIYTAHRSGPHDRWILGIEKKCLFLAGLHIRSAEANCTASATDHMIDVRNNIFMEGANPSFRTTFRNSLSPWGKFARDSTGSCWDAFAR